ncbi:nuclear pore complex NUP93A-like [Micractinium conductrix]|uniref:Nuclear pore protein n=1 Tax=Micractinium conductrix TaxID=554055 RepID=A0A2P6VN35_9CHLO|nr:nuclear pore complex NUP93A-like [Micractinium conductrix]|eukprot:PSC75508.1 nuclear pore complex NUP93A-like [Micractinium conductrix]
MAAAGQRTDWDQLLLQSQDLVRTEQAFPRVQRDITQVEAYSSKLRARAARGDAGAETLEASRLLAGEGLNPRKLTQALQTFELRPTYEDVFAVETATVDEYLQQVHEMISVTAIQEAQSSAAAAFEDFMDACMDSEWQQEKRTLFDSVAPYSAASALTPGPSPGGAMSPYAPRGGAAPSPAYRGTPGGAFGRSSLAGGTPLAAGNLALRGRAAKYAEVVRKLNAAEAGGQAYSAVEDFAAACADESNGERRTTMARVWQVLARLLGGLGGLPAGARAQRSEALVAGARKYLEDNFVAYMQKVVAAHRTQAALGGSPSRLGLVQAFLRVKERDRGALDFDQPGGVDTTWMRLYCCLRAGFHAEAVQVAKSLREGVATPRAGGASDLSGQLAAWAEGGCRPLGGDAGAHLSAECDRLVRDKAARARHPFSAQRAMVHALLAGYNRGAEAIVKESPTFFPTIEDFLWFKLGLLRSEGRAAGAGSFGGAGSAAGVIDAYTLPDLQRYLQQYPAAHYSHGGKEPLLYAVVQLLSLQFRGAVAFLAREAATRDYRLDAAHLAICLQAAGVLDTSPADAGAGGRGVDVGALIHRYAKEFLYTDPPLALEYYMLAAQAMGGSVQVKGQLLRELLVESKAYGYLLGSGGAAGEGGALARFVPDAGERGRVLEAVAHECAASAQLEEAVELFMFAGRPRQALRILSQRLSDAVEAAAGDATRAAEVEGVMSRGNAAVAAMASSQDPEDLREVEAFDLLKSIRDMLAASARGDYTRALQKLSELPFVPTERFRLQLCASGVASLHPAVADRLPSVLLAAAAALAAVGKREQLQTVVAFASAVPNRISQAVYQQLNQLQASVA